MKSAHDKIFLAIVGAAFAALLVVFLCLPRSAVSELERRELARFPQFSVDRWADGTFTDSVSKWFSDTEPYRDKFMEAHHKFKKHLGINIYGDEAITFHQAEVEPDVPEEAEEEAWADGREFDDYAGNNADANAKIAHAGIVVTGPAGEARALMAFGGADTGTSPFAQALNYVNAELGPDVNVYSMIIPTAIEFYCPDKVRSRTRSQSACLRNIYSQLDPDIHVVDSYTALAQHAGEPIYLRTDHHWAPLGAYYAAGQLARTARVPYRDISEYDQGVTRRFVGTMYSYSRDISVKESPEDFVYYTPKDTSYVTWFTDIITDREYRPVSERGPYKGQFFKHFPDGSGGAYCTMIGTDTRTVRVETGQPGDRKVLIIKDSFGNAVPGFLFGSFAEVHVIDFRYFAHSLKDYVAEHGITDVVYTMNIFNAYSAGVAKKLRQMVPGAGFHKPVPHPALADSLPEEQPAAPATPIEEPTAPAPEEQPAPLVSPDEEPTTQQ